MCLYFLDLFLLGCSSRCNMAQSQRAAWWPSPVPQSSVPPLQPLQLPLLLPPLASQPSPGGSPLFTTTASSQGRYSTTTHPYQPNPSTERCSKNDCPTPMKSEGGSYNDALWVCHTYTRTPAELANDLRLSMSGQPIGEYFSQ